MSRSYTIANAILWASAIIASAVLGAPSSVSLLLLPALATGSWLLTLRASASDRPCEP